MLAQRSLLSRA